MASERPISHPVSRPISRSAELYSFPGVDLDRAAQTLWSVPDSFNYCVRLAQQSAGDYPIVTWPLPHRFRPHVAAVYAFAKIAASFADAPEYFGRRAALLDSWETSLRAAYVGESDHPVFVALKQTVKDFALPINCFLDLLAGYRMNLAVKRYPTFASLLRYCEKAAHPLGRILAAMAGDAEVEHQKAADDLTTALFLLSLWRRIAPNLLLGRLYLPEEDLLRFSVKESDVQHHRLSSEWRALMAFEVARTRAYLRRAQPLVDHAPIGLRTQMAMVVEGAEAGLRVIEHRRFDVFSQQLRTTRADWVRARVRVARTKVRHYTNW